MILSCNLSDRPTAGGHCNPNYTPTPGQQVMLADESDTTANATTTPTGGSPRTNGLHNKDTGASGEERTITRLQQRDTHKEACAREADEAKQLTTKREGGHNEHERNGGAASSNDASSNSAHDIATPHAQEMCRDGRWRRPDWQKYLRDSDHDATAQTNADRSAPRDNTQRETTHTQRRDDERREHGNTAASTPLRTNARHDKPDKVNPNTPQRTTRQGIGEESRSPRHGTTTCAEATQF